jgi:hypothetical protein
MMAKFRLKGGSNLWAVLLDEQLQSVYRVSIKGLLCSYPRPDCSRLINAPHLQEVPVWTNRLQQWLGFFGLLLYALLVLLLASEPRLPGCAGQFVKNRPILRRPMLRG